MDSCLVQGKDGTNNRVSHANSRVDEQVNELKTVSVRRRNDVSLVGNLVSCTGWWEESVKRGGVNDQALDKRKSQRRVGVTAWLKVDKVCGDQGYDQGGGSPEQKGVPESLPLKENEKVRKGQCQGVVLASDQRMGWSEVNLVGEGNDGRKEQSQLEQHAEGDDDMSV